MTKLIISLTTIPPRFPFIHENLAALRAQTADVAAINLYIPRKYRRFDYNLADLPEMPDGVTLHLIDEDLGPATKVLPACRDYMGQDVQILFCDDDRLYDPFWARRFIDAAAEKPESVICEAGSLIGTLPYSDDGWQSERHPKPDYRKKDLHYRLKRAFSFGYWKPARELSSGYVDILEGCGGVLVRPEFFDESTFDIPDLLWTVDDVWLSGCLERQGISIWLNTKEKVRTKSNAHAVKESALMDFVYQGHDRLSANQACIQYFRRTAGIWGGEALVTE